MMASKSAAPTPPTIQSVFPSPLPISFSVFFAALSTMPFDCSACCACA